MLTAWGAKGLPVGILTQSGLGGANVRLLDLFSGAVVWEVQVHKPLEAYLLEPPALGVDIAFANDTTLDVFAMANAGSVYRMSGLTGEQKWNWRSYGYECVYLGPSSPSASAEFSSALDASALR